MLLIHSRREQQWKKDLFGCPMTLNLKKKDCSVQPSEKSSAFSTEYFFMTWLTLWLTLGQASEALLTREGGMWDIAYFILKERQGQATDMLTWPAHLQILGEWRYNVESLNQISRSCSKVRGKQAKIFAGNFLVSSTQAARKRRKREGRGLRQSLFTVLEAGTIRCNVQHLAHILHRHCSQWYFKQVDIDVIKIRIWQCVYLLHGRQSNSCSALTPTSGTSSKNYCCFELHGPLPITSKFSEI